MIVVCAVADGAAESGIQSGWQRRTNTAFIVFIYRWASQHHWQTTEGILTFMHMNTEHW